MAGATRAMTCIELIVFLILLAFVAYGAVVIGSWISDEWWGMLVGAAAGLAAFFLVVMGLVFLLDRIFGFGCPPCHEGSCKAEDYENVEVDGDYCLRCKHGFRYRRRGRRFVQLDAEGREEEYYVWKAFRGWRASRGKNE